VANSIDESPSFA